MIQQFRETVYRYFDTKVREDMPWRDDPSPYRVLVSEFMLQQTQVSRVIPYFTAFLSRWKSIEQLALAPLSEILKVWQGLGYNRRAKFLHDSAKCIAKDFAGTLPQTRESLLTLPGIGEYTAAAILVFAFNKAEIVLETNIRRAIIHYFYSQQEKVTEQEVRFFVEKTMDRQNPRRWYWALMDYGYWLRFEVANDNRKSSQYVLQSPFRGSRRQVRGSVLRILSQHSRLEKQELLQKIQQDLGDDAKKQERGLVEQVETCLELLRQEGMLLCEKQEWYLAR